MFLPTRFKVDIKNILKSDTEDIEIELRFRGNLNTTVLGSLDEYLLEQKFEKNKKFTVDYISKSKDKLRVSKEGLNYYETSKSGIINKYIDKDNFSLKLSVSKEVRNKIKSKPDIVNQMIREKDRTTYSKNNLQVDITEVKESHEKEISRTELEIEVIDPDKFNFEELDNLAREIYQIVSVSENEIIEFFTRSLGREGSDIQSVYSLISRPRDLQMIDLTNDGILKPFAVSLKADGVQKFMVLYTNGVYMIDSNNVVKISSDKYHKRSIYVGEYISSDNLFLPFDTIVHEEEVVKDKNYLTRHNFCKEINKKIFGKTYVSEKPIHTYEDSAESLNRAIIRTYQTADDSPFDIDGLIFTPIKSPYLANGQNHPLNKRVLSDYYDVCKYKKPEDLTIDFLVKDNKLWSYASGIKGNLKNAYFMNSENTDPSTFANQKWKNKIVEFKPSAPDSEQNIYTPIRIREDKNFPNKLEVAEKLFKLRKDPILRESLEGNTIQFMRKYHNQIKRKLISGQTGYVIDIGGGKGGDIDKYEKNKNIKKVFSIEPQSSFIDEYMRRLKNIKSDKFLIIEGGGEETSKIIKESSKFFNGPGKLDNININFMISLSFFWKDKKMLSSLAKTINGIREHYSTSKVLINFLTIEGTKLEQLFEQRKEDKIHLNNVTLIRKGSNKVYVDIKDSQTVHEQEEYLVKLDQLWNLVKFYPRIIETANGSRKGDYILSKNELTYSSLFVFGTSFYDPDSFNSVDALFVDEKQGEKRRHGIRR